MQRLREIQVMQENIQTQFNKISAQYDQQRKQLIPCFDAFYKAAVFAAQVLDDRPQIMDIGAGTGLLSYFLFNKYPAAKFTLIDISEKMLQVAAERFKNQQSFKYIVADYAKCEFDGAYDIMASALSIHHLLDTDKEALIKACYRKLKPNGLFINADQFCGETTYLDKFYKEQWMAHVNASGLSEQDIQAAKERMKLDKEITVKQHLSYMEKAGFSDIGCVYKYHNFAVVFGRKEEGVAALG